MKAQLKDQVRSALLWAIVPPAVATVVGLFVNRYVPVLNTWAIAGLIIAIVALIEAWRAKPKGGKISVLRVLWLIVSLVATALTGHFEWKHLGWPWSPWVGAGIAIAVWFVIGITVANLVGKRHQTELPPATAHTGYTVGAGGQVNVTQELMAQLGVPIGSGATVDLAALLNAMAAQAKANSLNANAALIASANEAVRTGILKPEQLSDRVRELLGVAPVAPQGQPQATRSRRPATKTIDWGDV